ncbi:hypothetical protein OROMI_028493 [Orobanche minor]
MRSCNIQLSQTEFAHNSTVSRTTGLLHSILCKRWRGPVDLMSLPSPVRADSRAVDMIEAFRSTNHAMYDQLLTANATYKDEADRGRRALEFEQGDFVWAVLTHERYRAHEVNKLAARKIDPLEVPERINLNACRLKLSSHIQTSDLYNVKHLISYSGDNEEDDAASSGLRENLFVVGENDVATLSLNFMEAHTNVFKPKK